MTETISTKQLAAILGISVQRVNELGRKGKIQREDEGGWNLVKVNAALRQNLDKHQALRSLGQMAHSDDLEQEGKQGNNGDSFSEAQRRHEWAKVEKEELTLRLRRGELIERSDVKAEWTQAANAFRNQLLLVPDKLAPKVAVCSDVRECRALVEEEMRRVLMIFSETQADAA